MSKIIKKIKKTNSKPQNFEKKNISHIHIFFKKTFRIFSEIVSKISNLSNKALQKIL